MDWNSIFRYESGKLYHIKNSKRAGTVHPSGYRFVHVKEVKYCEHRVIWEMHYGTIPKDMQIDHIWHNRLDNRIENLRLVDRQTNLMNSTKYANNKSGHTGVRWNKTSNKWQVFISVKGKRKHLGYFKELTDAVAARLDAENLYGFHPNHGK